MCAIRGRHWYTGHTTVDRRGHGVHVHRMTQLQAALLLLHHGTDTRGDQFDNQGDPKRQRTR